MQIDTPVELLTVDHLRDLGENQAAFIYAASLNKTGACGDSGSNASHLKFNVTLWS